MKRLKTFIAVMLLFVAPAIAQTKKDTLPPPPPQPPKVVEVEKPVPPPPPELKGHPWTRNGENVWVVKPARPAKPPKVIIPPPPPPPPSKEQ